MKPCSAIPKLKELTIDSLFSLFQIQTRKFSITISQGYIFITAIMMEEVHTVTPAMRTLSTAAYRMHCLTWERQDRRSTWRLLGPAGQVRSCQSQPSHHQGWPMSIKGKNKNWGTGQFGVFIEFLHSASLLLSVFSVLKLFFFCGFFVFTVYLCLFSWSWKFGPSGVGIKQPPVIEPVQANKTLDKILKNPYGSLWMTSFRLLAAVLLKHQIWLFIYFTLNSFI